MNGKGHHDMGGEPAGKVQPIEHDYAEWERRVDAIVTLPSNARFEAPLVQENVS